MLIDQYHEHSLALPELRRFLQKARRAAGVKGGYAVCLTTDEEIRAMNLQFRGVDKATDVLSFSAQEGASEEFVMPEPGRAGSYLGDLVISLDTAARQAEEMGHGLEQEVRILIVHGLLHLAGYDHETDRGEMREREEALRKELELTPGLIARTEGGTGAQPEAAAARPGRRRSAARKAQ